jgi:hypothetical protein
MKVKVTIEINVLSVDAVPALLQELIDLYHHENIAGKLVKEDDDLIEWETKISN